MPVDHRPHGLRQPQEEARIKLGQMNLKYNEDNLVRLSQDGGTQSVKLILQAGMSPNVTSQKGDTPLVVASRYGRQEVVEVPLVHGADPNTGDRQTGGTPLIWA